MTTTPPSRRPRQPHDIRFTRKVLFALNEFRSGPADLCVSVHEAFPLYRASIWVSPEWTAKLLGDPRRATAAADTTYWVTPELLWVMIENRLVSVINLNAKQRQVVERDHGKALRAQAGRIAGMEFGQPPKPSTSPPASADRDSSPARSPRGSTQPTRTATTSSPSPRR